MNTRSYIAADNHVSEYPEPITFAKGTILSVGEKYDGPEGWEDWFLCQAPGQKAGWVPRQILDFIGKGSARALEDYTARELDVLQGETLIGSRILNGWVWCQKPGTHDSGWVPLSKLREI